MIIKESPNNHSSHVPSVAVNRPDFDDCTVQQQMLELAGPHRSHSMYVDQHLKFNMGSSTRLPIITTDTVAQTILNQQQLQRQTIVTNKLTKTKAQNGDTIFNSKYRILKRLGQGSQAKVKLAIKMVNSAQLDMTTYVPEYFALKVYIKPYLRKQRSFVRSSSCASWGSASAASDSTSRRKNRAFLQNFTTALDDVYKEIEIMKRLDHPNIIKLYEMIDDPEGDKLYLVMPVADYGESIEWDPCFNPYTLGKPEQVETSQLQQQDSFQGVSVDQTSVVVPLRQPQRRCHPFHPNHRLQARNINKKKKGRLEDAIYYDEEQIRKMAKCLVDALDYLHNQVKIVHRDIKPSNVLLDESGAPMLVDFGKAMQLPMDGTEDNDYTKSIEGTYTFLPPESCSMIDAVQQPYSMKKADIWALGITLYILTYNRFPFELSAFTDGHPTTELDIMETIANIDLNFPPDSERLVSDELKLLLSMLLEKDPTRRPDISYIKQNSRFLNNEAPIVHQRQPFVDQTFSFKMMDSSQPQLEQVQILGAQSIGEIKLKDSMLLSPFYQAETEGRSGDTSTNASSSSLTAGQLNHLSLESINGGSIDPFKQQESDALYAQIGVPKGKQSQLKFALIQCEYGESPEFKQEEMEQ